MNTFQKLKIFLLFQYESSLVTVNLVLMELLALMMTKMCHYIIVAAQAATAAKTAKVCFPYDLEELFLYLKCGNNQRSYEVYPYILNSSPHPKYKINK